MLGRFDIQESVRVSKERKEMYYPPTNNPHPGTSNQAPFSHQPPPPPPPNPGQLYYPPQQPNNNASTPYNKSILFGLICVYIAFWAFTFVAAAYSPNGFAVFLGNVGISLFWGTLVSVLIMDRRGFFTLHGWIRRQPTTRTNRFLLGCLLLFVSPFLLGVYLVRVLLVRKRSSQQGAMGSLSTPSSSRRPRIGIIVGAVVAVSSLFFYSVGNTSGTTVGSMDTHSISASPTTTQVVAVQPTSQATQIVARPTAVPTKAPSRTPTMRPTPIPTHPPAPTPTPAPQPTQAQTTGVNGNPWGYNFQLGSLIYNPPSNFCDYFNCIPSFWKSTNGYVDECNDETYSHSGGVSGACSRHGGEMRPLYSH